MGSWQRNSACVKQRITRESATVSMTPDQEQNLHAEHLLHCMNPEEYFIFIEDMQEQHPLDMETIWDE
jgi:hypothetical protein